MSKKTETITIKEYKKLSKEDSIGFYPVYKTYKKTRSSSHCEECGQFTGYVYFPKGIGKIIGFERTEESKRASLFASIWSGFIEKKAIGI